MKTKIQLIINEQVIPASFYFKVYYKYAGRDHEATQRYFFRAKEKDNIIPWMTAGLKEGWLNKMVPAEENSKNFYDWQKKTFGVFEKKSDDNANVFEGVSDLWS